MVIVRFFLEWIKWTLYGQPVRTQEKIDELYQICNRCPNYDEYAPEAGFGTCRICGCNINKGRSLNKLAWGTTHCPDKPPRW